MGRTWSEAEWDAADARVAAALEAEEAGGGIRPHPDLPFEDREPGLVDYQPELGGAIEGDDGDMGMDSPASIAQNPSVSAPLATSSDEHGIHRKGQHR